MNRQNLIQRLVDRKMQSTGNVRAVCVCFVSPNVARPGATGNAACYTVPKSGK